MTGQKILPLLAIIILCGPACSLIKAPYTLTKATIKTGYRVTKLAVKTTVGTGKIIYKIGKFTYTVVKAPLNLPLTHGEIRSIAALPPKEAIRRGQVKYAPYVVFGKRYIPFDYQQAKSYRETGIASWYGNETLQQKGGHMTANGELFDPHQFTAAHKLLPLPIYARVTNLENNRSIIVRINDRGPFVPGRIIDLTTAGAKALGFYRQGTARVLVETISLQ